MSSIHSVNADEQSYCVLSSSLQDVVISSDMHKTINVVNFIFFSRVILCDVIKQASKLSMLKTELSKR
jgi:hypothetical protein